MEGSYHGPRRARRVAQQAAIARTPEGNLDTAHALNGSPIGNGLRAGAGVEPQLNAAQRLLMDYYEERGTPPAQIGMSQYSSPQPFEQGRDRLAWQQRFANDEVDNAARLRAALDTQQAAEEEYASAEDMEETIDDQEGEFLDDDIVIGPTGQFEDQLGEEPEEEEEEEEDEELEGDAALPFDPSALGLKEISNLGKFTVSSHKPGNGVEELRSDDTDAYWQSDGPQPHRLTVYFVKRVGIRDVRFYVDYHSDESYTPTKIVFKAGTSENQLIEFATMELTTPSGWQQVPVMGAGGGPDGNTLACHVLQMQILENHQNGKDTHLRGIKIYAADSEARNADAAAAAATPGVAGIGIGLGGVSVGSGRGMAEMVEMIDTSVERPGNEHEWVEEDSEMRLQRLDRRLRAQRWDPGEGGMTEPSFMKEPEIR